MAGGKSVLIVGAGAIGVSSAYYASRAGFDVTVVERAPNEQEGCSSGNAGLVVPSHFIPLAAPGMVGLALRWMWNPASPFYVKPSLRWDLLSWCWKFYRAACASHVSRAAPLLRDLNLRSLECFEELSGLTRHGFALSKKGLLVLCKSEHRLAEEARVAETAAALGIPARVLNRKETGELEPALRMEAAGSVYFPKDCHLLPERFLASLRALAEQAGVRFAWSTEAEGWRVDGNRIAALRTTRGELTADEYVICGGAWSPVIARGLCLKLPLEAGKGYSLTLRKPPRLPAIPFLLAEARVAVTPMDGSLRFGGTMEIAGLDRSTSPARVGGIIRSALAYFPDFTEEDFRGIPAWSGLRPCSPDGLPYLGRASRYRNLVVATGHAMMGLSLGPITGRIVAEILAGKAPGIDLALLNPERYG